MRKLVGTGTRSRATWAALVAAAALVILLGVGAAQGAKQLVGQFGGDTTFGAGGPQGVAVEESTGEVLVGDRGNRKVQRFGAAGNFISAFGGTFGTTGGLFNRPWGVAVDQVDESVYVVDLGNNRVQKFDRAGGFIRAWGWDVVQTGGTGDDTDDPNDPNDTPNEFEICTVAAQCKAGTAGAGPGQFAAPTEAHPAVDPTTRNVYVPDPRNNRIQKFDSSGNHLGMFGTGNGQFGNNAPTHVGVDSAGNVYALDRSLGRVQKFDSSGSFVEAFAAPAAAVLSGLSPHAIAVDRTNDHLYVAILAADDGVGVPGEVRVVELDSGGSLVDTHGKDDRISPGQFASALAVNPSTGQIYISQSSSPRQVFILDDLPVGPATATIRPATDVESESATLNGTVNPNGSPATYHFEYSTDGAQWTSVPVPDAPAEDGTEDVPVSQAVSGLEPNTEYRARLVAKTVGRFSPSFSDETRFTTDAVAPVITHTGSAVAGRTATLVGRIRPRNALTSYRFEYGTDTGYGSSTPVGSAGSGSGEVRVSELIEGLEPDTSYHFRLVAANAGGETVGPDRTFTTSEPPSRAYEMVSPLDKGGDGVLPEVQIGQTTMSAASGDGVFYGAFASFAGNPGSTAPSVYRALREPPAWQTDGITPPKDPALETAPQQVLLISDDLSHSVVSTNANLTEGIPPAMHDAWKLYLHDIAAGTYKLLTTPPPPGGASQGGEAPIFGDPAAVDADADLSHVLIETVNELTPDAVGVPGRKLYLWSDLDGSPALTLASVLPDPDGPGGPLVGAPTSGSAGNGQGGNQTFKENAISDDGSVIYFTSPPESGSLYRRTGGETELVGGGAFQGATPDGSTAFFTAVVGGNTVTGRRDFDTGTNTGTTIQLPVQLVGFSDDGSRGYGVSSEEFDDAPAGQDHLYYWEESGAVRYIGDLGGDDGAIWSHTTEPGLIRGRRAVASDGSVLAVASDSSRLTPADPSDDNGGFRQVYVYDADADRVVCASCPRGAAATGPANFSSGAAAGQAENNRTTVPNAPRGNISADGERAFFQTATPLVVEDTNGQIDVYVYEQGRARLISSGKSDQGSIFAAASPSGEDVFFSTTERLVGWDTDNSRDLYDARVGGGLPEPPILAPPCAGDACQGAPAGRPSLLAPVSDWFRGLGNAAPGARAAFSLGRLSRAARARLARGGRAVLPVRVNRAGRVALTARAKLSKRSRIVARSSRTASRPGTVKLPLRLSKAARRRLARGRPLRVSLSVRFAGVREPKRLTLPLRRPGAGSRGAVRRAAVPATEKGR